MSHHRTKLDPVAKLDPVVKKDTSWFQSVASLECPAFQHRRETRSGASAVVAPAIVLERGSGSHLVDHQGRRYLDLVAGFGAAILGHSPAYLRDAIAQQAETLIQGLGDVYPSVIKLRLIEALSQLHPQPGAQVLLCQSGGDAVAAAQKTAALTTGKPGILAFRGAYHGLGYGPLAACGFAPSFRKPFQTQLNAHVHWADYPANESALLGTLQRVDSALKAGEIGAILVEPVLGRGGIIIPPKTFMSALIERAHQHGALVIADEIWTGMGRCGALLKSHELDIAPDLVCVGKGLGGGLPISAVIGTTNAMVGWRQPEPVIHTSTHSGAPLACAAALATLEELERGGWPARAKTLGAEWLHSLQALQQRLPDRIVEVRGEGFMVGVELRDASAAQTVVAASLEQGVIILTGGINGSVLTLTPALNIDRAELLSYSSTLESILR